MAHPHFVFDEIADFFVSHRCLNPIPLGGGYSHNGLKSYESILTAIDHSLFTSLEYGFQSTLE
jgi:hypothetical protein